VVVDWDTHRVLDQLADRTQETLRADLQSWTPAQRAAVTEVAVDFWAAYHTVAAELLLQAHVVGDRFHVQKHLNAAVNATRRLVQRRLPAADREFVREWRTVLLRNEEDLEAEEWIALAAIKASIPELERVHTLKEDWRAICTRRWRGRRPRRRSRGGWRRRWVAALTVPAPAKKVWIAG